MSTQVAAMRAHWADARAYSWSSFLHALDHAPVHSEWTDPKSLDNGQWLARCGSFTYEQARDLAHGRNVWPEGRREVETIAREQASKIIRAKRPGLDYLMDTTGQFFDVPSVVENRPESWLRPIVSDRGERHTIRLIVDMSISAGLDPAQATMRASAIAACALTLQAQNQPIELIAFDSAGDHTPGSTTSQATAVHLNEPGRPLDIARLTALAHPSWLRRLMFRLQEITPDAEVAKRWRGGYGSVGTPPDAIVRAVWGRQAIVIPTGVLGESVTATIHAIQSLIKARIGRKGCDDAEA